MRTTIDIPENLMKKVKVKAAEEGITLKDFFINILKQEVEIKPKNELAPWKALNGTVEIIDYEPEDVAFDEFYEPEQEFFFQVNEPKPNTRS